MRTSLNEIKDMEDHLLGKSGPEEKTLFQARLILTEGLKENLAAQEECYLLIRDYGRKQLKQELAKVHQKLFCTSQYSSFRERILQMFRPRGS